MKRRGRLIVNSDPHGCIAKGHVIHRESLVRAIVDHEFAMDGVELTDQNTGERLRIYQQDVYRMVNGDMQKASWWE